MENNSAFKNPEVELLLDQVEDFVSELFETKLSGIYFYHNFEHTKRVVERIVQLTKWEGCTDSETRALRIAGWFHDTGFIENEAGHEAISAKIAADFLKSKHVPDSDIELVKSLILASTSGVAPHTKLEMILKDADCSHVASDDYFEVANLLKNETSIKENTVITELDWLIENKSFFKNHQFYTDMAKLKWQPLKERNALEIDERIAKLKQKQASKLNSNKPGRGVETMFRVTLRNHIDLSAIADTKANILLSVNAIIISIVLSNLIPKLDNPSNFFLVIPTLVLMVFSVVSVVLSVLSTRPNISNVTVTKEMIKNKQTNILFFGNFHKMGLKDFEWGIEHLIENQDVLYDSLAKDLYYLGLVLERKYRLLRITYTVFVFGIVISALVFMYSYYKNIIT